ncbi:hypothetical protein CEUSTIGMA_g4841.t1 [Chlamydomonas eustigma]|uniref:Short-chain dehydrogenase/reductase SDR n=1 Tax=Chlamydomonas eustigma TaxID=1157962 RepID=A0A250X2V8_9CHLO|nr:hypothetical protein CEUSTIGMA_g4841.t1 [Chlamydomonas eustigma]|eukprot:GAX77395.1 hypothetical protein CEUSTIGMA_g4841.t1 [Chlamydomonas eustigma]
MITRGCTVVATSRNLESMEQLRGSSASFLAMDVTDEASIQAALDKAISLHGRVDLLVNNAGCAAFGPVMEMDLKVFKDVFEVNLMGVVAVSKAVTPHMLKQGGGRIVNIGSIAAWQCVPFTAPYSASKAALESLSQAMRLELKPFGIHVLHVAPGFIRSSLGNKIRGGMVYEGSMFKDIPAAVEKMDFLGD